MGLASRNFDSKVLVGSRNQFYNKHIWLLRCMCFMSHILGSLPLFHLYHTILNTRSILKKRFFFAPSCSWCLPAPSFSLSFHSSNIFLHYTWITTRKSTTSKLKCLFIQQIFSVCILCQALF